MKNSNHNKQWATPTRSSHEADIRGWRDDICSFGGWNVIASEAGTAADVIRAGSAGPGII